MTELNFGLGKKLQNILMKSLNKKYNVDQTLVLSACEFCDKTFEPDSPKLTRSLVISNTETAVDKKKKKK